MASTAKYADTAKHHRQTSPPNVMTHRQTSPPQLTHHRRHRRVIAAWTSAARRPAGTAFGPSRDWTSLQLSAARRPAGSAFGPSCRRNTVAKRTIVALAARRGLGGASRGHSGAPPAADTRSRCSLAAIRGVLPRRLLRGHRSAAGGLRRACGRERCASRFKARPAPARPAPRRNAPSGAFSQCGSGLALRVPVLRRRCLSVRLPRSVHVCCGRCASACLLRSHPRRLAPPPAAAAPPPSRTGGGDVRFWRRECGGGSLAVVWRLFGERRRWSQRTAAVVAHCGG